MPGPSPQKLVDLRIAHLNMTQGVIGRMSGYSAGVKNYCVTICAAIIAVAFQRQIPTLVWAAIAVVLIFGLMDTYYLALERRYRELYERTAARPVEEAEQMSLKAEGLNLPACLRAARSVSVLGFYALLLIGVVTLLTVADKAKAGASGLTGGRDSAVQPAPQSVQRRRADDSARSSAARLEPGKPTAGARNRTRPAVDSNTDAGGGR